MNKYSASKIKKFFEKMDEYYDEVSLQQLVNLVNYFEDNMLDYEVAKNILEGLSLRDRHTCISLSVVYNKSRAYSIIDGITLDLTKDLFEDFKKNIRENTLPEYFNGYTSLDFFCLQRSIDDDGKYDEPYLEYYERDLLLKFIDFYQGKREKILKKGINRIGTQVYNIEKTY